MTTAINGAWRTFLLVLLAAALCLLPGCADVSEASFERIAVGMEIREVQNIMGTDGRRQEQRGMSISSSGISGQSTTAHRDETYTWESGRQRIIVHTRNGIVTSKHKEGF